MENAVTALILLIIIWTFLALFEYIFPFLVIGVICLIIYGCVGSNDKYSSRYENECYEEECYDDDYGYQDEEYDFELSDFTDHIRKPRR